MCTHVIYLRIPISIRSNKKYKKIYLKTTLRCILKNSMQSEYYLCIKIKFLLSYFPRYYLQLTNFSATKLLSKSDFWSIEYPYTKYFSRVISMVNIHVFPEKHTIVKLIQFLLAAAWKSLKTYFVCMLAIRDKKFYIYFVRSIFNLLSSTCLT